MSENCSSVARFRQETTGSVAIIFALLATALFGVIALAIDVGRAQSISTRLSAALDAAALAGAKALDNGNSDAEILNAAEAYFRSHVATLQLGGVDLAQFTTVIDRKKSTVTTNINASMPTSFGRIFGKDEILVDRASTVTYKTRNVELALALDTTGSMGSNGRLSALQSAAKEVIDTLYGESSAEEAVRVAIVPWSTSVNAGPYAGAVSNGASTDGCVVERQGAYAATDTYPAGADALNVVSSDPRGWYNCTVNPVMPLMGLSKKDDLKTAVDSFVPVGGTAGHIGMAWGYYTLSPAWNSIWPNGSKPNSYSPSDTVKAVLLMSDGEFNVSWLNGTSTDFPVMVDEAYNQLAALCTEMKAKQILVFTVGFGMADPRAQTELQACASGTKQFFQAATGAELKKAFKEVATQLKGMRLSK